MSATVMAPVEAPMANTPSSLPDAMDQVRLSSSPVVETVTTASLADAVSASGRGVGHGRGRVGDRDGDVVSVSVCPAPSETCTARS